MPNKTFFSLDVQWTQALYDQVNNSGGWGIRTNTPHSPWGVMGSDGGINLASVTVPIYAYLSGGYEGTKTYGNGFPTSLAQNLTYIQNVHDLDGVHAIFLDEVSGFPAAGASGSGVGMDYIAQIWAKCQSLGMKLMVNFGQPDFDTSILNITDYVMTSEQYHGQSPTASELVAIAAGKDVVLEYSSDLTADLSFQYYQAAVDNGYSGYFGVQTGGAWEMPLWFDTYIANVNEIVVGAPVAIFTADKSSGAPPLTVQFTNLSTGTITTYAWDFGDGGTSTEQNPSHVFATNGTYTVSLTVTGPGGTDTKSGVVTVAETPVTNSLDSLISLMMVIMMFGAILGQSSGGPAAPSRGGGIFNVR